MVGRFVQLHCLHPCGNFLPPPRPARQGTENDKQQPNHSHNDENGNGEGSGIQLERYDRLWHGEIGGSKCKKRDDLEKISYRKRDSIRNEQTETVSSVVTPLCCAASLNSRVKRSW